MRNLSAWLGFMWLVAGCTVPELGEVLTEKSRSCNAEHSCSEGYLCVEDGCVPSPCKEAEPAAAYPDEDLDGYGRDGAAYTIFCGSVPRGYAPQRGDCDDAEGARNPGLEEVCDGRDNDCDGTSDEGAGASWYPDRDQDGFGDRGATPLMSCTEPPGPPAYVKNGTDCLDSDASVFPRADVPETRCDEVDDDCDGSMDDGFPLKGTACSDPCPGSQYVCNAQHTGLTCYTPGQFSVFADSDRDGAGKEGSSSVGTVCPGGTPVPGTAANTDDCDDLDPYNRRGLQEICDARDNTCDGQSDEGGICAGKGWKVITDTAVTVDRQWRTVALGLNGYPVWVAGASGKLAVRESASQPFLSLDGGCGNINWLAAWVRGDGNVFLAGEGGQVAQHNGATCSNQAATPATSTAVTGIIGFASGSTTTLYLVNTSGRLYTWTPGTVPQEQYNLTPESYAGIHGLGPTLLLAVGGTDSAPFIPTANSYPGTGSNIEKHTMQNIPGGYSGSLRAVWMGGPGLAYAVGDAGLVVQWNGATNWVRVAPPTDNATASFTSVVVLDPSSVYSTDTNGVIRRLAATGWSSSPLFTLDQPLRDIAASSPGDIWAVGDNGRVVHFPE